MSTVLKFELDGEFRRARLEEKSWAAVVEAFERSFPELAFADVTLKYADDEGDMCLLSPSSFADFKALTEGAKNAKVEVVRSPMPGLVVAEESNEPMETEPVLPAKSAVDEGCMSSSASSCGQSNKPPPAHSPELFDLYSDASSNSSCSSDEEESACRRGADNAASDMPKEVAVAKEDFKAAKRAYKLARREAKAERKASKAEFKAHKKECSLEKKACKALLKQEKQQLKEARRARKQSGCSSGCSSFAPPARLSAPPAVPAASAPPSSGKLLSFPVEVEDGRRLTISWRQGDPVFTVAKNFATEHHIGDDELATIVEFIHIAERSVAREAAVATAATVEEPAIPMPSAPPAPDYQESVQQLADMGFIDVDLNLRLLEETNGDLQAVTTRLLNL